MKASSLQAAAAVDAVLGHATLVLSPTSCSAVSHCSESSG